MQLFVAWELSNLGLSEVCVLYVIQRLRAPPLRGPWVKMPGPFFVHHCPAISFSASLEGILTDLSWPEGGATDNVIESPN